MTNYRKQLSAKTAWARMTTQNRKLRETLEVIAGLASRAHGAVSREAALNKIRQLADSVLSEEAQKAA